MTRRDDPTDHDLPPTIAEGTPATGSARGPSSSPGESADRDGRTFRPGEWILGRYRVVRFLAEGGMGEVWEAWDREIESPIALKTVRPRLLERPEAVGRFKREIQLARKVTHRNVCRIFDLVRIRRLSGGELVDASTGAGRAGEEILFLTMELVRGETLAQRLASDGPMPPAEAEPIVDQMIAALEAAHEAGVIHRDFKCANVMLEPTESGPARVVVTDFGIARSMTAEEIEASLTSTGLFIGTPSYMAPEQVEGKDASPATDVYSLGVVLYEMVTGSVPFGGTTPLAVAVSRLTTPPPRPRALRPGLDPRWERIILRCLARRPEDRFASVREVGEALFEGRHRVSRRTARRLGLAGALLLGAVLVALLFAVWPRLSDDEPASDRAAPAAGGTAEEATVASRVRSRRSVAVVGFQDLSPAEATEWLAPALSHMMSMELSAGEDLRVLPEESVTRMRRELDLEPGAAPSPEVLQSIRSNLGTDLVVTGSYLAVGPPDDRRIRVDLRLSDAATGDAVTTLTERGSESDLFDLVSDLGASLRRELGADRPESYGLGARASLPDDPEAARLYARGLDRLESFDPREARRLLESARNRTPGFPLVHSALARAYAELGLEEAAETAAVRAFELSDSLPREERYLVEGRALEISNRWDEAAAVYRRLFGFFPDSPEYGLRLGTALIQSGQVEEAETVLAQLRDPSSDGPGDPRVDLLAVDLADAKGDYERMLEAAQAAARRAASRGARLLVAEAKSYEAWGQVFLGHPERALPAAEKARRIYSELGDPVGLADSLSSLAPIHSMQGRHETAASLSLRAAEIHRQIGNRRAEIQALQNLTYDRLVQGHAAEAEEVLDRMEDLAEGLDLGVTTANQIDYLRGWLWHLQGRSEEALRLDRELLGRFEELGDARRIAQAWRRIGEVLLFQGDVDPAREALQRSVDIPAELGVEWYVAQNRLPLAEAQLLSGELEGAEDTARAALGHLDRVGAFDRAAIARSIAARALLARGRSDAAREILAPAIEVVDDLEQLPAALAVARARVELGDTGLEEARRHLAELLDRAREHGNVVVAGQAREALHGSSTAAAGVAEPAGDFGRPAPAAHGRDGADDRPLHSSLERSAINGSTRDAFHVGIEVATRATTTKTSGTPTKTVMSVARTP